MDLFHVRRDNHKPQADRVPGALPALWRYHVPDLEIALPADAKGVGALIKMGCRNVLDLQVSGTMCVHIARRTPTEVARHGRI
jgi:hypothetical protein